MNPGRTWNMQRRIVSHTGSGSPRRRRGSRSARSGLAPLELTLSLPIMLFVMGLMVIAGTTASWKVRTVTTARESAWRTLWPRDGSDDPHPRGWPESAAMDVHEGRSALTSDPWQEHQVVRGQPLPAPTGETLTVRDSLMDMQAGMIFGEAHIDRPYPMLGNMPPGEINITREHPVLNDRWQYQEMGLSTNHQRRVLFLYPADYERAISTQIFRYQTAALELIRNADNPVLRTLSDDLELRNSGPGGLVYEPPYGIGRAPDYYIPEREPRNSLLNPRLACSYSRSLLQVSIINPLVDAIQGVDSPTTLADAGVPGRLTRDHLAMHQQHISHIDNLLALLNDPNTPLNVRSQLAPREGQMRSDRDRLQTSIDQLLDFQTVLLSGP